MMIVLVVKTYYILMLVVIVYRHVLDHIIKDQLQMYVITAIVFVQRKILKKIKEFYRCISPINGDC